MEKSGFFNANKVGDEYDRVYLAQDFAAYFASFIGNGVFPNPSSGLQVMASSGMTVNVLKGQAWINGYWYDNSQSLSVLISPAEGTMDRIDAIAIQYSSTGRVISCVYKKGTPSVSPVAPTPKRDADAYELILAHIRVVKGAINIQQLNISDTRLNTSICGLVHGVVTQLDTTTMAIQLQGFIDSYISKMSTDYSNFKLFEETMRSTMKLDYDDFMVYVSEVKQSAQDALESYQLTLDDLFGQAKTLYDNFNAYLNTPTTGLKSKADKAYNDLLEWFEQFKVLSTAEFNDWFESIKEILDESVAATLLLMVQELQSVRPNNFIVQIDAPIENYPSSRILEVKNGAGQQGFGNGGFGDSEVRTCESMFEYVLGKGVKVYSGKRFLGGTSVTQVTKTTWIVAIIGTPYSLIFNLR